MKPNTTLEKRAAAMMAEARKTREANIITLEWRKNYEGIQAVVLNNKREVVARTKGGGYDKESVALAKCLRFLPDDEDVKIIGGGGFYSVQDELASIGWVLNRTHKFPKYHLYILQKENEELAM